MDQTENKPFLDNSQTKTSSKRGFGLNVFVLCCAFAWLLPMQTQAQSSQIKLIWAKQTEGLKAKDNYAHRLTGDVHLRHDSTDLYCDSAWLYLNDNRFEAFGNVLLKKGDSVELECQYLSYGGNQHLAKAKHQVYLKKDTVRLYSDEMHYHIKEKWASYQNGGRVINDLDTLSSQDAMFDFQTHQIVFKHQVEIRNADLRSTSEYLDYNTKSKNIQLRDDVRIYTDSSTIFLDRAKHIHYNKEIRGSGNIHAQHQHYTLFSDSVLMHTQDSTLWAWGNIHFIDSIDRLELKAQQAILEKQKQYNFFSDSVFLRQIERPDTFYCFADTMELWGNNDLLNLEARSRVRLWREALSLSCSFLKFDESKQHIKTQNKPLMWLGEQQIVADSALIKLKSNTLDSAFFDGDVFLMMPEDDTLDLFSQVKGQHIAIDIDSNALSTVLVDANVEVLYCMFEEEKFTGINRLDGAKLKLFLHKNEISRLVYLLNIEGKMRPSQDITKKNRFLSQFKDWRVFKPQKSDFQINNMF
ncbi:MAG: OstA-like protein [Flavobacteriales bacterium]